MAKINKQEVMQKLIDELQLYPGKDLIPSELADKILAVYQINAGEVSIKNPTANVVKYQTKAGQGTATIYTTPSTGKFYLTNAAVYVNKGAGDTGKLAQIKIYVNGVQVELITALIGTLSEQSSTFNLQNPILVDPGTIISVVNNGDGQTAFANIVGYTES